jgi:ABC-type proline/glycine betaine transport system substrate-binding protein
MKTKSKRLAPVLALVLGALSLTGCGALGHNKVLILANIGWDENVALSNLTKVLLEGDLGYERVDIDTSEDLDATYRGVASGDLDAFQDVWLPPTYGLKQQLVEGPTAGMLDQVGQLCATREEFVFLVWSPHWMNQRYDIRYLLDPKDAMAYAFMDALALTEKQIDGLEFAINKEENPVAGARRWTSENREVVQSWIE